ncbi:MAG: hypothetical protein A2017_12235 [Lentisphaerae bacterium GWF2_44_16]|nr:MAG: hypothetical protein A2017_12235 [Lentisphaerae bacterium GWF2_44_16]
MELTRLKKNEVSTGNSIVTLPMLIYFLLFLLGLWGCMAIYNATFHSDNPFHYAGRQFLWLIIGIFALFAASSVPFEFYKSCIVPLALITYIPLWLVLFWGISVNGMHGWFEVGSVFIQPSEFAKTPFVMLLCMLASDKKDNFRKFISLLFVTLLYSLPIALQPDFGTLFIYIAAFITVYWIAGGRILYMLFSALAILPFSIYFLLKNNYVFSRLTGFLSPESDPLGSGWHICQFRYTLARGGFWGESWGKALWANSYLPLSHSDSAFASLTESLGFAGSFPVVAGLIFLSFIIYRLSLKPGDNLARYMIFGIGALFIIQALVHISVNVTLIPPTGITLPILSYGGSSLISTMIGFGILLSASEKK